MEHLILSQDGARIKVWPGIPPAQVGLNGVGGGVGSVKNVTYDTMHISNDVYDIELTQCYGAVSTAACAAYPVRSP
jgi:galacturan 1,4-alpha-galacturonidase